MSKTPELQERHEFQKGLGEFSGTRECWECGQPRSAAIHATEPPQREIRRRYIADEELRNLREEYDRWVARKHGVCRDYGVTEWTPEQVAKCSEFCAAYIPALLDAIKAMEEQNQ